METALRSPDRLDESDSTAGALTVVRDGPRSGIWPWRSAIYAVYRREADGAKEKVFSGRFRSHKEALRAAYESIR